MIKVGSRFGRLVVIGKAPTDSQFHKRFICRCDCGNERINQDRALIDGRVKSCGCWRNEIAKVVAKAVHTRHGLSESPTWNSWRMMRVRCYWKSYRKWKDYGGRGIKVCDRWRGSFENFLADMGKRPGTDFSIDRIDVNGHYEPGNCRWATAKTQQNNRRRIELKG